MDVSKKPPCNDKKMVVKISTGGVGTVILVGSALATAALTSAFIVGLKKRRSSVVKKSEANDEFVYVDEVSSDAVTKEVESDNALLRDVQSLELDEKTDIDNDGNGVEQSGDGEMTGMDHEEAVEITQAGNRIEENVEECCDQEDKTLYEIHNDEMEVEKNSERKTDVESQLNGETEELKIEGVEKTKLDLVANTETDQDEGETTEVDDGDDDDVEKVNVDTMGVKGNPSKEVNYDDEEPPVIESPVMQHKNADSDVKDGVLPTDMVDVSVGVISENQEITKNNDVTVEVAGVIEEHAGEVIQEDGVTEGVREDEVKYVVEEELLEEEQKEIHQFGEEISCEITDQVNEELYNNEHDESEEENEENSNNENEPGNQELGDCERNVENLPILEKEIIILESIECEASEEVPENNLLETIGKEVEDSSKTIDVDAEENTVTEADLSATTVKDTEKTSIDLIMETNEIEKGETEIIVDYDEMDLSDEVEESSVGTGESSTDSNSETVWPAEESSETQQVNLMNQEIEGKALEDKQTDADNDFHDREIKLEKESQRASNMDYSISRNAVKKYFDEFSMVKDQPENAMKKGMLIVILSVLSSYSCSWLFGCSFVKLSLIMFISIVLSKIHGY